MTLFHYEAPFSGNAHVALHNALSTLLPLDFKVIGQTENRLTVEGPGYNSSKQNALLGMSSGEFTISHGTISLLARLGGVDRMAHILLFILIGLGSVQALVFIGLWLYIERLHANPFFLVIPALVFLPWVFITPRIIKWTRGNCENALARFVDQLASPQDANE
jgi:hypothetical protein